MGRLSLAVTNRISEVPNRRHKHTALQTNFLEDPGGLALVSLACSNLMAATLTKSVSIVHQGYAVAAGEPTTRVAFCLLYRLSHR